MIHSIPADKLVMFGDAGILLQAAFCANEEFVWRNRALVEQMVNNWNRIFNYRYAEISEQAIREQLTGIQRRNNGFRIRRRDDSPTSTDESNGSSPPHLFGGLSSHDCGIEILLSSNAIGQHSLILESAMADQGDDMKNVMAIKSALYVYQSLAERASENISKLVSFDSDLQRISQLSQGHSNLDIRYLAKFCHETMVTLQKTQITKVEKDFD